MLTDRLPAPTPHRRHLDEVVVDPAFSAEMLDEARWASEANRRVLAQLGFEH